MSCFNNLVLQEAQLKLHNDTEGQASYDYLDLSRFQKFILKLFSIITPATNI